MSNYQDIRIASSDASFRRYFRVSYEKQSYIVMDAPPEKENCSTFIQVAKIFSEMKLNVPKLIKTSLDEGFILMTDFGNEQYLDILNSNVSQNNTQYKDAINTLLNMQKKGKTYQEMFSPYSESLIRKEMNLFIDWFIEQHHGYRLSKSETENWLDCMNILTQNAISQPQVLVHRDYHSRNLMFLDSNNPGILDFQDAVIGPITYDLVSLLRDCYISLNLDVVADFSLYFYKNLDEEDKAGISHHQFTKFFDLMGIQRHLKAVGIFTRLNYRDGKSVYLKDIPRTLKYILTVAENYPEIIFLVKLIKKVKCRG